MIWMGHHFKNGKVESMSERTYIVKPGKYYKANLHCHTVVSDGNYTPEQIKKVYQKEGYSIVAYTDHCKYVNHSELNDENFIAIAAFEVGIDKEGTDFNRIPVYHLNLYDTNPEEQAERKAQSPNPMMNYEDIEGINEYIREMNELGFLVCYNHPYWSLQEAEDYLPLENVFAMEIFNFGCELDGLYGYHPHEFERALRSGKKWYAVATDDNHNGFALDHPLNDSFGGFVMIRPEEFSYPAVMKALREGNFYSSMGPEFYEVYVEGKELVIRTSPVEKIFVKTRGRFCHRAGAVPGQTIQEARFTLRGDEEYIWVEIRDGKGKSANSNACFL